ncbi:MAG: hypothetical protein IPL62_21265 [Caulobacteraceae bacterium]|nr:hypothetical protein [Caulobacteraceae bacterium]
MTLRIIPAIMSGGAGTRLWPLSTGRSPETIPRTDEPANDVRGHRYACQRQRRRYRVCAADRALRREARAPRTQRTCRDRRQRIRDRNRACSAQYCCCCCGGGRHRARH